ncbi:unnamed protein product [Dovyalis caffra]|uniref:Uncharacterized protein n=1 Tax=Dovyalis caffra TaxID=77055 RepID=A0AAV1S341_9ROSI|nr:unnamed protein product [Dovyalis caffra]
MGEKRGSLYEDRVREPTRYFHGDTREKEREINECGYINMLLRDHIDILPMVLHATLIKMGIYKIHLLEEYK